MTMLDNVPPQYHKKFDENLVKLFEAARDMMAIVEEIGANGWLGNDGKYKIAVFPIESFPGNEKPHPGEGGAAGISQQ